MQLKREFGSTLNKDMIDCVKCEDRNNVKYRNALKTSSLIMSQEGMRGFFKGLGPKCLSQSLSTAISWTAYETLKSIVIGDPHKQKH